MAFFLLCHDGRTTSGSAGCLAGIIERVGGSMEEEMWQLRCSRPEAAGAFCLSDGVYFCKKGLESIVDDQVTQRFSSEELASWNLLTRTNQNFYYISLRLTIIWGLGVFVRYCILLPFRSVSVTQISLPEAGTDMRLEAAKIIFLWLTVTKHKD